MKFKSILKIAGTVGVVALVCKYLHDHVDIYKVECATDRDFMDDELCSNKPAKPMKAPTADKVADNKRVAPNPVKNEAEEPMDETIEKLFGTPGAEKALKQEPMEFPADELDVEAEADSEVEAQEKDPEAQ